jgi:hypothetical protein
MAKIAPLHTLARACARILLPISLPAVRDRARDRYRTEVRFFKEKLGMGTHPLPINWH